MVVKLLLRYLSLPFFVKLTLHCVETKGEKERKVTMAQIDEIVSRYGVAQHGESGIEIHRRVGS